jgi:hypothetical protein
MFLLIIINRLGKGVMDYPMRQAPRLYALPEHRIPQEAVSHFLTDIRQCLVSNQHEGSFGSLFGVGISADTTILCCVFGSRTPEKFIAPKELTYEWPRGFRIPVLVTKDYICPAFAPPRSWVSAVKNAQRIDLSGYSIGQGCDLQEAGSFGFFAENARQEIYGFTAAHCTPTAKPGDEIVSPSCAELTGRLKVALRHTSLSPPPRLPARQRLQKEVESLLREFTPIESEDGCEIDNELQRKRIMLNGKCLGTVIGKSAAPKSAIVQEHNVRLTAQKSKPFALPRCEENSAGSEGTIPSRIEWCCFKILEDR